MYANTNVWNIIVIEALRVINIFIINMTIRLEGSLYVGDRQNLLNISDV